MHSENVGRKSEAISTRFSSDEVLRIEDAAKREGLTRGEWMRKKLLASLSENKQPAEVSAGLLMEEIEGVKLLVLNLMCSLPGFSSASVQQLRRLVEKEQKREADRILTSAAFG